MAQNKTILVVGVVADDGEQGAAMHPNAFDDFEAQSVYEVVIRLKTGRPLPAQLMTLVRTRDELQRLTRAASSRDVRLAVTTDLRAAAQPQNVDELLALLPEQARPRRRHWCQTPPD